MPQQLGAYVWNPYTRSYQPLAGKPVDTSGVRAIVAELRAGAQERLAQAARDLQSGKETNLTQFSLDLKDELKQLYISTHVLARGGIDEMDQSAWGMLGAALREQYDYANSMIRDIENGNIGIKDPETGEVIVRDSGIPELSDGFLDRVDLYTDSAWGARGEFENVVRDREVSLGSLERRVLGDSKESCADCIEAAAQDWQPPGILPDIGDTECNLGCNCNFEFENDALDEAASAFGGDVAQPDEEKSLKGDWNEEDHPRDDHGRFGSGSGDSKEISLGMPKGEHTPEGQAKLISILNKETGMQFKPYGSVASGSTSKNDIDIVQVPQTEAEQEKQYYEAMQAESATWARVSSGEITQNQAMEELGYGDTPHDAVVATMGKLGFEPTKVMDFTGITVLRFENKDTNHTVEIWTQGSDPYAFGSHDFGGKSLKGGPGSGNFGHSGIPGQVGGSGGGSGEGSGTSDSLPKLEFEKAKTEVDYKLIEVSISKLDASWQKDEGFHIGANGEGSIAGRTERFKEWLSKNSGVPIMAPRVSWNPVREAVSFGDGRHRFAVLRDMGYEKIKVSVPNKDAEKFKTKFG